MISSFTRNVLVTFAVRVLTVVFGIGISAIIARVLGPEKQGIYSLVILLPALLVIFTNFGVAPAAVFYISRKEYSAKEVFGNNVIFTVIISALTMLIGWAIVFFFGFELFPGVEKVYLFLALFLIPFSLFSDFISHVLLGLQKITKYNIISFLQSLCFLLLVAVLLWWLNFGIKMAILAQIFSFLFCGIILFFFVKKETQGISVKFDKQYFKNALSYGLKTHLGSIFSFLHYRVDLLLLNFFINPIAVGFYAVSARLAEGIWLLSFSAATVLFPKVAAETDKQRLKELTPLVCRNVLFVTSLIVVPLFILARLVIVFFYSEKFLDSVQIFQILLIGTLFISGWRILANDIIARGKPMVNTYITGFSLALNIILNIVLIPLWGITGAAWTTTISYLAMFIITVFVYGKISGNTLKEIIIFQRSDLKFYKNIFLHLKNNTNIKL